MSKPDFLTVAPAAGYGLQLVCRQPRDSFCKWEFAEKKHTKYYDVKQLFRQIPLYNDRS